MTPDENILPGGGPGHSIERQIEGQPSVCDFDLKPYKIIVIQGGTAAGANAWDLPKSAAAGIN
jgi:hypothetical protein